MRQYDASVYGCVDIDSSTIPSTTDTRTVLRQPIAALETEHQQANMPGGSEERRGWGGGMEGGRESSTACYVCIRTRPDLLLLGIIGTGPGVHIALNLSPGPQERFGETGCVTNDPDA